MNICLYVIDKILFDEESGDTMMSVFTDCDGDIHIQLKSDSGCEVFNPTIDQLLALKQIITEYTTHKFEVL